MTDPYTGIVTTALAGAGYRAEQVRLDRVDGLLSHGLRRGYAVQARTPEGAAALLHCFVEEMTASEAAQLAPGAQAPLVLQDAAGSGTVLRVWLYPHDPALPALPAATVPAAAEVLLGRLGLPGPVTEVEVRSYRPGKRAVVRVVSAGVTHYLKIVRPEKAAALRALHAEFLDGGLPVPRVLGFSPDGLLLLEEAAGEVAAQHLTSLPESGFLQELDRLRVRLAALPLSVASRPGPMERASWYCGQLAALLPVQAVRLQRLERRIAEELGAVASEQLARHGDLHLEQVMVDQDDPGSIVGLIDLDTAGIGDPASDTAGFTAELLRRSLVARSEDERTVAVAAEALARQSGAAWSGQPGWRAGVAAHLIAHALTPASLPETEPLALQLLDAAEGVLDGNGTGLPARAPA